MQKFYQLLVKQKMLNVNVIHTTSESVVADSSISRR